MNRKVGHLQKPLMDRLMRVNPKVNIPATRGAAATELDWQPGNLLLLVRNLDLKVL
jgi:hypothetical protein